MEHFGKMETMMRVCANSILGGCAKNSVFFSERETFLEKNPGGVERNERRGWLVLDVTQVLRSLGGY